MHECELITFPKNECEALALIYIQQKNLHFSTPANLYDTYHAVLQQIVQRHRDTYGNR